MKSYEFWQQHAVLRDTSTHTHTPPHPDRPKNGNRLSYCVLKIARLLYCILKARQKVGQKKLAE